jgi:hypothetical protein
VKKSVALAITIAVLAAGCGGGGDGEPAAVATQRAPTRLTRDYVRLNGDVQAIRAQAAKVDKGTLLGTPGLRRTTGAFLDDLETSSLSLKAKNRMIDHAAAAVAASCEQCFQMLEAVRPIPQIAGH